MISVEDVSTKEINRVNEALEKDIIAKYNNDIKLINDDTRITLERIESLLSIRQAQIMMLRNIM